MKPKFLLLLSLVALIGLLAVALPAHAAGKVRIVATLTDLADLARNIGGDRVEVGSLATGVEDTHGVPMKPSFVPMMNRADLLLLVGLDCEHAFLPALIEASKNPRIQRDRSGYIDCSKNIMPLDVPKSTDHYAGDVHPYGNPHYMLDPVLAKTVIGNIYKALATFDPEHQAEYAANRDAYLARLNAKIAEWEKAVAPIRGIKFVSYHEHWPYFAERLGLVYFGTIESEAGHRSDPAPHRGADREYEGRACHSRRAGAAISRKGAEARRATDRRNDDNAAHHARRRTPYGDIHENDGLYYTDDGHRRPRKEMTRHEIRCANSHYQRTRLSAQ